MRINEEYTLYPPGRHIINLDDRKFTFLFAVGNRSKYTARDVFVQFFFKKEKFEDDAETIIDKLEYRNPVKDQVIFYSGWSGPANPKLREFKESFAMVVKTVQGTGIVALNPIDLKLEKDEAELVVSINNLSEYRFVFKLEK